VTLNTENFELYKLCRIHIHKYIKMIYIFVKKDILTFNLKL